MKMTVSRRGSAFHAIRAALAAALLVPLGLAVAPPPDSDGRVTHTVNGNTEIWRIDEPNVKKKISKSFANCSAVVCVRLKYGF